MFSGNPRHGEYFPASIRRWVTGAMLVSLSSAVTGLLISAQDWARTATGATIIIVACGWFLLSMAAAALRREQAV